MTAGRMINNDNKDWCTPPKYVNVVREFFGTIDLDPCSNSYSLVNADSEYIFPHNDGLQESWDYKRIYVNPPYGIDKVQGTSIKDWIRKCWEAHFKNNSEVLALIPVAVNTRHWKEYIFGKAQSVCFLADTRLKFINGANDKGAPMACCMVYWGEKTNKFYNHFSKYGAVIELDNLKKKQWVSPDIINSKDAPCLSLNMLDALHDK